MQDNPYQSPQTNIDDPHPYEYRGSPWKGIALGLFIDIIGTIVVMIIMALFYYPLMLPVEAEAITDDVISRIKILEYSSIALGYTTGTLISIYASYTCARIINHREYLYILIQYLIITFVFYILIVDASATGHEVVEIIINAAAYFIGAHLYRRKKVRAIAARQTTIKL